MKSLEMQMFWNKILNLFFFGFLKQSCHKRKVDDATKYRVIYEKASLALELQFRLLSSLKCGTFHISLIKATIVHNQSNLWLFLQQQKELRSATILSLIRPSILFTSKREEALLEQSLKIFELNQPCQKILQTCSNR